MRERGPVIEMHLNHLLITPFLSAKRCLSVIASVCNFIMFFSTMFSEKKREKQALMIQTILFHFEKYMNEPHF